MEIALVVLMVIGSFFLGLVVSWLAKGYVEDYIENAAYAKAVTHPEMLDEDGNLIHDELIYLRTNKNWKEFESTDDDDEDD